MTPGTTKNKKWNYEASVGHPDEIESREHEGTLRLPK